MSGVQCVLKRGHLLRLLRNDTGRQWVLGQNDLVSIIKRIHPFSQNLPYQTASHTSISCKVVDVVINTTQESVPSAFTVSWVFLRFPKFSKNQRLLQNRFRVCQVTCQPPLHKCHMCVIVLSRKPDVMCKIKLICIVNLKAHGKYIYF